MRTLPRLAARVLGAEGVVHRAALGLGKHGPGIAKAVGDRIAPVAAEILQCHFDTRGRLPALVFGEVDHTVDPQDGFSIKPGGDDLGDRLFTLDRKSVV